jgi:hypothetical protein
MALLVNEEDANPPEHVEIFFNSVAANGGETLLTAFTFENLAVIPRVGEIVHLGTHGAFNVSSVRHECLDRAGTASPMLGRVAVLLRKRSPAPRKKTAGINSQVQIISPVGQGSTPPSLGDDGAVEID